MILQPHLPQGLQNSIANSNTIEESFERTKKKKKNTTKNYLCKGKSFYLEFISTALVRWYERY